MKQFQFLICFLLFTGLLVGCNSKVSKQTELEHSMDNQHEAPVNNKQTEKTAGLYTLQIIQPNIEQLEANKPYPFKLIITNNQTLQPERNFQIVHEKKAHLIVFSRDLNLFQHIHPTPTKPGEMDVEIKFPQAGKYVLFLQFSTLEHAEQLLRSEVSVLGSNPRHSPLVSDTDQTKTIDNYRFQLTDLPTQAGEESMPTFHIAQKGQDVNNIEPYLGAGGHVVIISADTKQFIHVHPMTEANTDGTFSSPIMFHTVIKEPGIYKLWGQFKINGQVKTVDFTFNTKQPR